MGKVWVLAPRTLEDGRLLQRAVRASGLGAYICKVKQCQSSGISYQDTSTSDCKINKEVSLQVVEVTSILVLHSAFEWLPFCLWAFSTPRP